MNHVAYELILTKMQQSRQFERAGKLKQALQVLSRIEHECANTQHAVIKKLCKRIVKLCNKLIFRYPHKTVNYLRKAESVLAILNETYKQHGKNLPSSILNLFLLTLNNWATYHQSKQAYHMSLNYLLQASKLIEGNHYETADTLQCVAKTKLNMSALYSELRRYTESIDLAEQCLVFLQKEMKIRLGDRAFSELTKSQRAKVATMAVTYLIAFYNIGVAEEANFNKPKAIEAYENAILIGNQFLKSNNEMLIMATEALRDCQVSPDRPVKTAQQARPPDMTQLDQSKPSSQNTSVKLKSISNARIQSARPSKQIKREDGFSRPMVQTNATYFRNQFQGKATEHQPQQTFLTQRQESRGNNNAQLNSSSSGHLISSASNPTLNLTKKFQNSSQPILAQPFTPKVPGQSSLVYNQEQLQLLEKKIQQNNENFFCSVDDYFNFKLSRALNVTRDIQALRPQSAQTLSSTNLQRLNKNHIEERRQLSDLRLKKSYRMEARPESGLDRFNHRIEQLNNEFNQSIKRSQVQLQSKMKTRVYKNLIYAINMYGKGYTPKQRKYQLGIFFKPPIDNTQLPTLQRTQTSTASQPSNEEMHARQKNFELAKDEIEGLLDDITEQIKEIDEEKAGADRIGMGEDGTIDKRRCDLASSTLQTYNMGKQKGSFVLRALEDTILGNNKLKQKRLLRMQKREKSSQ